MLYLSIWKRSQTREKHSIESFHHKEIYLCDSKSVEKVLWRFQSKESCSGKDEAEWDHANLEWKKIARSLFFWLHLPKFIVWLCVELTVQFKFLKQRWTKPGRMQWCQSFWRWSLWARWKKRKLKIVESLAMACFISTSTLNLIIL